MTEHLCCRIAMTVRIDLIESVSQDTHCWIAIGQCLTMGMDIDTISQTTDNQYLRTITVQILDEMANQVLSIGGAMTGANDTDDSRLVQIGITFIIEDDRGIRTFRQALGIVLFSQCEGTDTIRLHILELGFCPFHRFIPVFQGFHQTRGAVLQDVSNVMTMLKDKLCTTNSPIEFECRCIIEVADTCQRHSEKDFVVVHCITFF